MKGNGIYHCSVCGPVPSESLCGPSRYFDFDDSSLQTAPGYISVPPSTYYSSNQPYGWQFGTGFKSTGHSDLLLRDYQYGDGVGIWNVFTANMPNGTYNVTMQFYYTPAGLPQTSTFDIYSEGVLVYDNFVVTASQLKTVSFQSRVYDKKLDVKFVIQNGSSLYLVNSLSAVLVGSCYNGQTQSCGSNTGICSTGTQTCSNGVWGSCTGGVGPSTEICDGVLDENCNGVIDEGCSCVNGQTQYCGPSNIGVCRSGTQTCSNGMWGACTGAIYPTTEICDGLDNDCNGQTDETCLNCSDSDGGDYPYIPGTVTYQGWPLNDFCNGYNNGWLYEYYCVNGDAQGTNYTCPYGCNTTYTGEGRCN